MPDLDPAHVDAVGEALCPRRNGRVCPACHGTASRIVADPSALLAALARVGVLSEERRRVRDWSGTSNRSQPPDLVQRRYATRWEDIG